MRTEADTRMSSSLNGTIAPSVVRRARGKGTTALISQSTMLCYCFSHHNSGKFYPLVTPDIGKIRLRNAFFHRVSRVCSADLGHSVPSWSPSSHPHLLNLVHHTEAIFQEKGHVSTEVNGKFHFISFSPHLKRCCNWGHPGG